MKRAAVGAVLALALAWRGEASDPPDPYRALLRSYARGAGAEALAGVASLSEEEQRRGFERIRVLALQAERCPACPAALELERLPLKSAVMLHTDRDEADRPRSNEAEQRRVCPGWQAELAGRYAALMARWPTTRDFARRFFIAMASRCQWDACLDQAQRWGEDGVKLFPRDGLLLFGLGSVHEESAALMTGISVTFMAGTARRSELRSAAAEREQHLRAARRLFTEAAAADGGLVLARVRLGRVQWALGDREAAGKTLEGAIARTVDPGVLYLARLFLGRVHEDAGRLDEARVQYRLALELDPQAQAAALALSHVLRLASDLAGSRQVLAQAVAQSGRRARRDLFWDYLMSQVAEHPHKLFDELRRESLR